MDKTFTLNEFVFIAQHFLVIEEALFKKIHQGKPGYKKELTNMLDRLERLEQWFEVRQVEYLVRIGIEFSMLEQEMDESLTVSADEELTHEQMLILKKQRLALIKRNLRETQEVVKVKFLELNGYALNLKLKAFAMF